MFKNTKSWFYSFRYKGKRPKCRFYSDLYCGAGTHYASKGMNKICYEGELWESPEDK